MSDNQTKGDGSPEPTNNQSDSGVDSHHITSLNEESKKHRLRAKAAEERVAELETANKLREEDEAKKKGNYEKILSDREAQINDLKDNNSKMSERIAEIDSQREASRQLLLNKLPEDTREIYKDAPETMIKSYLAAITPESKPDNGVSGLNNNSENNPIDYSKATVADIAKFSDKQFQEFKNRTAGTKRKIQI